MGEQLPRLPWTGDGYKLWDFVTVGGKECPGLAVVKVKRANKWDEKKAKGSHGGDRNFSGADLAKGSLQVTMLTEEQHEKFKADILPQVEPVPGKKKPDALVIGSPILAARSVTAVTIDDVDGPDVANGQIVYTISWTEARAPEKKNASGLAGHGVVPAGECSALKNQLSALAAEQAFEMNNNGTLRQKRAFLQEQAAKNQVKAETLNTAGVQDSGVDRNVEAARQMLAQNEAEVSASDNKLARINNDLNAVGAKMQSLGCNKAPPSQNPQTVGEAP